MADLGDGDAVCLRLRSDPRYLCLVRAMIGSFASLMGFDDATIHRLTLAVDEGCTNIIRHAHGGSPDGDIEVTCRAESLPDGRRQMVVRLVDDVRFAVCADGRNALDLTMRCPDPPSPPDSAPAR